MEKLLLSPPVVFVIVFLFCWLLSALFSKLAIKTSQKAEGTGKSYACGENVDDNMGQPDYSQFFPFAFFFTIAHVATMVVTTIPLATIKTLLMAEMYVVSVVVCLCILLRGEK